MGGSVVMLGDIARRQAKLRPEATALLFEGRRTSYGQFDRRANQVANGLRAMGIRKSDRIAFLGRNSDAFFELLFGAAKMGAVVTPVNWRLAWPEAAYIIDDSEAPVLFAEAEFAAPFRAALQDRPYLRKIVAMDTPAEDWPEFAAWRDAHAGTDPGLLTAADDVAMQLYTSGTTGRPKGAMLTHANFAALILNDTISDGFGWNDWAEDEVNLVAMPVAHIAGTAWGVVGLHRGAANAILRQFDPAAALELFHRERITRALLVPAALQMLVRHPKAQSTDFSALKQIQYGASPMPLALLCEAMERLRCQFVQLYGMTETCGAVVALPPEDHVPEGSPRMRSAGKAVTGVEVSIVDAEGTHLPPGSVGEIVTRSSGNMAGYWKMPDASASTIDAEGWLHTGDIGQMDADGYVFVLDRLKDMIISGGENVYPAEVEDALYSHPALAEAAVIGVPDETWGEAVKAIVVLRPGAQADPADIMAWARQRIAGFKVPKSIDFSTELPRNASGKVLRRMLREPYWEGRRV